MPLPHHSFSFGSIVRDDQFGECTMRILFITAFAFCAAASATAPAAAAQTQPRPDTCGASKVKGMTGKRAHEATVAAIRKTSGAESTRVIKPGQAVTADYRIDRLNVSLNKQGRIRELSCG